MTANEAFEKAKKQFGSKGDIQSDGELYEVGVWLPLGKFIRRGSGKSWEEAFSDSDMLTHANSY